VPLTPQQIRILKSPVTRARLPGNAGDFSYVDTLLRDTGPDCPRLPAVWEKIFPASDKPLQAWLAKTFATQPPAGPVTLAPVKSGANIVRRAMSVLQSYKKT